MRSKTLKQNYCLKFAKMLQLSQNSFQLWGILHLSSANTEDNAQLLIANVNAESNKGLTTEAILRKTENEEKRMYNRG